MQLSVLSYLRDESGAIGVDFVVMGAGVVAGVIAVLSVVSGGSENLTNDVSTMLAEVDVGTPPGALPWAGPQSGTAAAEAGGSGAGVGGGSGIDGELSAGLGTGSGSGETGGSVTDDDGTDISELEELIASLETEVLVVDPAVVVEEVVTDLIQDAVDGATAAIQILAERDVWVGRIGDAAYPQAADVVAAFDQALISQGLTPPV